MIDSVVFIKQDIEDVINYYLSISDSERIVENENIIVDNLLFKEKNKDILTFRCKYSKITFKCRFECYLEEIEIKC